MEKLSIGPKFRVFPEILTTKNKLLEKYIKDHKSQETWVATEKIHGTNFAFVYDGHSEIICSKRNSYLDKNESFFNFQSTLKKYEKQIIQVFEILKSKMEDLSLIKICGELYGGKIQQGVFYSHDHNFEAFDLFCQVNGIDEDIILNYKEAIEVFQKAQLPYAFIQAEGNLEDLLKLEVENFQSTIYQKHGLEKIENNIAEGFVLKPLDPIFIKDEEQLIRVCIKLKSSKFMEKAYEPVVKTKNDKNDKKGQEKAVQDLAISYINQVRIDNMLSKFTEEEKQDQEKMIKMVSEDAWKDFCQEEDEEKVALANESKENILKRMKFKISSMIKKK